MLFKSGPAESSAQPLSHEVTCRPAATRLSGSTAFMPRLRLSFRLSPARAQQLQTFALAALALLLALGGVADVSVDRPRGPYDWRERVIVLLPGVCAQPAE